MSQSIPMSDLSASAPQLQGKCIIIALCLYSSASLGSGCYIHVLCKSHRLRKRKYYGGYNEWQILFY